MNMQVSFGLQATFCLYTEATGARNPRVGSYTTHRVCKYLSGNFERTLPAVIGI